jgi:hypothetical protein
VEASGSNAKIIPALIDLDGHVTDDRIGVVASGDRVELAGTINVAREDLLIAMGVTVSEVERLARGGADQ